MAVDFDWAGFRALVKRLDDLQTLPRKSPVTGAEFNKLIESQITTWSAVARRAKVEVIA